MTERHDDGYFGYLGTLDPDQQHRVRAFMGLGEEERWARMYQANLEIKEAVERLVARNPWGTMARYGTTAGAIVGTVVGGAIQAWRVWR